MVNFHVTDSNSNIPPTSVALTPHVACVFQVASGRRVLRLGTCGHAGMHTVVERVVLAAELVWADLGGNVLNPNPESVGVGDGVPCLCRLGGSWVAHVLQKRNHALLHLIP